MDGKLLVGVSLCHLGGGRSPPPGTDSEHPAGPREKGSPSGLEECPLLHCSQQSPRRSGKLLWRHSSENKLGKLQPQLHRIQTERWR